MYDSGTPAAGAADHECVGWRARRVGLECAANVQSGMRLGLSVGRIDLMAEISRKLAQPVGTGVGKAAAPVLRPELVWWRCVSTELVAHTVLGADMNEAFLPDPMPRLLGLRKTKKDSRMDMTSSRDAGDWPRGT